MRPNARQTARQETATATQAPQELQLAPVIQLWLMRILLPLGGMNRFARGYGAGVGRLLSALKLEVKLDEDGDPVDRDEVLRGLRRLHQRLELEPGAAAVPADLRRNVQRLADLVGLSAVDARLLEFATLLHTESLLDDVSDSLGELSSPRVLAVLAQLLALPLADVKHALGPQGALARSALLMLSRDGSGHLKHKLDVLSAKFADRLVNSETDPIQLIRGMITPSTPGHLGLDDFSHVQHTLTVLQPYLAQVLHDERRGVNVLIHGVPGVGKNQLVKTLAQALAVELFEVAAEDDDGDPIGGWARLRAYRTTQCFFGSRRALILFDEVEDIFSRDDDGPFGSRRQSPTRKAWINRMLEGNPIPTFWLTNDVSSMDPAFVRRFDVVLELPVPPRRQRLKIIEQVCGTLLDSATTAQLADCEQLAPAVLTRAAAVIQTVHTALPEPGQSMQALRRLVSSTLGAQGHAIDLTRPGSGLPEFYDPQWLNIDADPLALAQGLARSRSARLCLHGLPGTGKTAFAQWLARELGRPALLVRASDLLSKWVGDNEQNLARVFRQAAEDDAVLVIDEVDSFLQDRRGARAQWELTLVNEMLTQMEQFEGLFIASTNRLASLDPAALRRFDLKLGFEPLRPAQAAALCRALCGRLGLPAPAAAELAQLDSLAQLTPGDFSAVARQHRFRPCADAAALVQALAEECALRQPAPRRVGFLAAA